MEQNRQTDSNTRLVLDETTIYEVDLECCRRLSEEEKREAGVDDRVMGEMHR